MTWRDLVPGDRLKNPYTREIVVIDIRFVNQGSTIRGKDRLHFCYVNGEGIVSAADCLDEELGQWEIVNGTPDP